MPASGERRVLVAACASEAALFRALFAQDPLSGWQPLTADSFAEARFVLQHNPCDLVLVDEGLCSQEDPGGLAWLACQHEVPVILMAGAAAQDITQALRDGVNIWLPREMALAHPPLLAAALDRATDFTKARRNQRRAAENLQQCRRQIDRLVGLLWRSVALDTEHQWLTQRHMLERLQEETVRAARHGGPLTVALGQIHTAASAGKTAPDPVLPEWTTERITQAKRRCDVAGQYGLQGFMLLLTHTPKEGAVTCCRRLQQLLEQPDPAQNTGPRGPIRAYFGVASFATGVSTSKGLLRCAEQHVEAARAAEERLVAG
jgi:diguanylate cyclase (GGDEF)-like protein